MRTKLFGDVAASWLSDKKQYVKKSTYCAYSLLLKNHLMGEFSRLHEISEEAVQDFVFRKLQQGLSQKAVKDMLAVLKMILRYAGKRGLKCPQTIHVKFPPDENRLGVAVFSRENQMMLMSHIHNEFTTMNLGVYLSLCAGLRIGEVCALKWKDIDIEEGLIRVSRTIQRVYVVDGEDRHTELIITTPKSRSSVREVPVVNSLLKRIRQLTKDVCEEAYVLTNTLCPIEPRTYRNYYDSLLRRLGLPKLKYHGLRHSFATRCIESKCDYKTLSALMGHSNIATTLNLYVHPDIRQKRKCVEQMSLALAVDIDGEEGYEIAD